MTTNLIGHMLEFYNVFRKTLNEPRFEIAHSAARKLHTGHRVKVDEVQLLLREAGFLSLGCPRTVEGLAPATLDGAAPCFAIRLSGPGFYPHGWRS